MTDPLNEAERSHAARQGWEIATVYDTRGYVAEAIVPSAGSPFTSPFHARQFVWDTAKVLDPVCQRALKIVANSELAGKSKTRKKRK